MDREKRRLEDEQREGMRSKRDNSKNVMMIGVIFSPTFVFRLWNVSVLSNERIFCGGFYRSTFVGSAWSFVFSYPPQRSMTSDFKGFFYPRFYPLHLFSCLNF